MAPQPTPQLFEDLIASSDDAIVTKTLHGIVTSWNPAAERMFGYSAAEIIGRPMTTVFPPDRIPEEARLLACIARGEKVAHFETVRMRRDGSPISVSVTLSPLRDASGRIIGASKIARDISERVERDELAAELALESQRYAAVIASSDDAIITKTLDGIVTSWNPAAERIFGYSPWEIMGQPMSMVFPADRLDEEPQILARIARGEHVDHFETVRMHKSGRRLDVSISLSPVRDGTGTVIGASKIVRDITERRAAEHRAQALARDARMFQAIVASSDDAIASKTLDGTVTSWNVGAERIFGWTAAEIIGRPMSTLFPADRLDEEPLILARLAAGERIETFETQRLRKDGSLVDVSVTISPIIDDEGRVIGASKIARDITQRIQAERTIWLQANYDTLTQLPNRRNFRERLRLELARAERSGKHVAVMFIDLDRFKEVNDSLGHQAGDALLMQAAERIRSALREVDTVARMGGDEFTVLLPDLALAGEAAPVAHRLNDRLFEPFLLDGTSVHISGSIGVAVFPDDSHSADELLQHADQAMYESKRMGRNQMRYFAQVMEASVRDRLQLAADLRHAIARDELRLVYQPVVDLRDGRVHKVEALLRWRHPVHGPVSPARFIPLAEETGLIREIGDWVFHTVVRQAQAWRGRFGDGVKVGLNLSPAQLHSHAGYFEHWMEALARMGLPGDALVVEITEGVMVEKSDDTAAKLRALRAAGMLVAIDDFGTGYSSLAYLSRLDINYLKIDQTFTRTMTDGPRDLALCEAIVVMAHKLGLKVIAEGVETVQQHQLLQQIGCDFGQGYHFAAPAAPADIEGLFASGVALGEAAACA